MASVDRIQGLSGQQAIKTPCRLATTANITLSGEQTIDGVAAVEGDRVLVKDQTTTTQNGVYDVSTGSWTRSLDFDGPNDIADGTMVLVNSGSTYADKVFKLNATEPITIDTTALTFTVATDFTDISAFAATLLDDANAAAMRATLGLVIGTNVQAYSALLAALAAQTEAANKVQYYTADDTPGLLDFKDEDDMSSNSATAVPSQQSVKAYVDTAISALPVNTSYDSGDQTITAGGALTLTHGLSGIPKMFQFFLHCSTPELGFAAGDYVVINPIFGDTTNCGVTIVPDATNINVRFGSVANVFNLPHYTNGVNTSIDITKWKFVVRAYA